MSFGKIKTGYLAKYNEYPDHEEKILVMRGRGNDELAPSKKTLDLYKNGEINWIEYKLRFGINRLQSQETLDRLEEIKNKVIEGLDVRLICYEKEPPCHRFILQEEVLRMILFDNWYKNFDKSDLTMSENNKKKTTDPLRSDKKP